MEAITATLGDGDETSRRETASLAGELGPVAVGAFEVLADIVRMEPEPPETTLAALASIGGARALPLLAKALEDGPARLRIAALHGLAGLGSAAAESHEQVAAVLNDPSLSLRERLEAAHALVRIGPTGDAVAHQLISALAICDRWLRIGLLRTLARRPSLSQKA